jgi:hypothetical protein
MLQKNKLYRIVSCSDGERERERERESAARSLTRLCHSENCYSHLDGGVFSTSELVFGGQSSFSQPRLFREGFIYRSDFAPVAIGWKSPDSVYFVCVVPREASGPKSHGHEKRCVDGAAWKPTAGQSQVQTRAIGFRVPQTVGLRLLQLSQLAFVAG